MKFINTGSRHLQSEFLENIRPDADEGNPRFVPSYYETAKKAKNKKPTKKSDI